MGHVLKVSLPTDFSLACISGLAQGTTPETIADILHELGFRISTDCVRISRHPITSETKATVKAEDPSFAKELGSRLKDLRSGLSAVPIPIDTRRTECKKVHMSWHKATRSVWLNYGSEEIANMVAQKFNNGRYKCLGQFIKCSVAKRSFSRASHSHNPVAWTIVLSDVPGNAAARDVDDAIRASYDKQQHIEVGPISHQASDPEVSVKVRSLLEEYGQLENFYLGPTSQGKRVKAAARFMEEADAKLACSLNNKRLEILSGGKLTVTLVQSAKIKIQTKIFLALKSRIENERKTFTERHLAFRIFPNTHQGYTVLKVEGDNAEEVAFARKKLDEITAGMVLEDRKSAVWAPVLNNNSGSAYKKLKLFEQKLGVVLHRDKATSQIRFYGPPEKLQSAIIQVTEMLQQETTTSYEIDLKPPNFAWMLHGGFKSIEQALGKNVAIFNVVSKRVTITGTEQQFNRALAIMDGKDIIKPASLPDKTPLLEGDCPICFCEADNPVQTSCMHTYCMECLEDCCKSAASTSKDRFQVDCQGDGGTCSNIFSLRELKVHLSSSIFESLLRSSFEDYLQRRPDAFRYCPTPDCGYIYRNTASSDVEPQTYHCQNCLESICTSCHARHGTYTCAEYKDIASGGYEALKRLKKELNVKDCPKCTTPMEKTEGCNHMTCGGCKAHICWVCMAVFETSRPCYDHMHEMHGGIGIEPLHLEDW